MAFKKGQSGNPAGRPEKTKVITQMLTSALNEAHASGDKTKMRAVIDAWITAAIGGELPAIIAIADRLDGKPAQAIVGGDDDDNPVNVLHKIERVIVRPNQNDDTNSGSLPPAA